MNFSTDFSLGQCLGLTPGSVPGIEAGSTVSVLGPQYGLLAIASGAVSSSD